LEISTGHCFWLRAISAVARDGKIAAWTDSSRSSLNWFSQSWNFRTHRLSNLIVLSSEQYEVIGRTSLKFFAGYCF
jgi:hypothetical protein